MTAARNIDTLKNGDTMHNETPNPTHHPRAVNPYGMES